MGMVNQLGKLTPPSVLEYKEQLDTWGPDQDLAFMKVKKELTLPCTCAGPM
jgi:hypothetical protein